MDPKGPEPTNRPDRQTEGLEGYPSQTRACREAVGLDAGELT